MVPINSDYVFLSSLSSKNLNIEPYLHEFHVPRYRSNSDCLLKFMKIQGVS